MTNPAIVAGQSRPGSYVQRVNITNPAWYLSLSETNGTTAAPESGPIGTYVNAPQLGVTSIARDDVNGRSVGFCGAPSNPSHITCLSPLAGPDLTIDVAVQLDTLSPSKQEIITSGGSTAGHFGVEILANGQVRAFSYDSGGAIRPILGAAGNVQQGVAHKITYQRQSGTSPSQRMLIDGAPKAVDSSARTWAAVPAHTVYIGKYPGASEVPLDGLVAHVAGWNRYLSQADIDSLVRTQSVAWAENIDVAGITVNEFKVTSVKQGGWHGKEPLIASAGNGSLVTTSGSGDEITIQAGPTVGDDAFTYSFIDANSNTSQTRTVNVVVQSAQGSGFLIGGIDWAAQGYELAWSGNPDPSHVGLTNAQLEAALQDDWSIISTPGEQHYTAATRGGRTVLRCAVPDDIQIAGNWHLRPLGANGAGKTGCVLRYELYLPNPGGWRDNGDGGKITGLWGASPGVTHIPGGSINYDDAASLRIAWSGSQRFMIYAYIANKNQAFGDSYIADDSINGDNVSGYNNDGATNNSSEHLTDHRNEWTRLELELIWNTGTNDDGIIRLYINSVLKHQRNNVRFTNVANALPMGLWIPVYDNGNIAGDSATEIAPPVAQIWDLYGFEIWAKP